MKAFRLYVAHLFLITAILPSCRQHLDLTGKYEETTIVYALLDLHDSVHYFRIERGFIDSAESALRIAADPDSIYYKPGALKVTLLDSNNQQVFDLKSVEGDSMGLIKKEGIFARYPNRLYQLAARLNDSSTYILQVEEYSSGRRVQARTHLLGPFRVFVPATGHLVNWGGGEKEVVTFSWQHLQNAGIYDMRIRFFYSETDQNGETNKKSIDWKVFTNRLELNPNLKLVKYDFRTVAFYQNLAGRIPFDSTVSRHADSLSFELTAGGIELARMISNQKVRDGLLSGYALPVYSNISGGYGIFSSRYQVDIASRIGPVTLDSIERGRFTRHLNFR